MRRTKADMTDRDAGEDRRSDADRAADPTGGTGGTGGTSGTGGTGGTGGVDRADRLAIPVTGMTCAACASRVQRKLERAPGVSEASVNFGTERATVVYDPASLDAAALVDLVKAAGYGAVTEQVVLPVEGLEWAVSGEPVERELRALRGVIGANVNIATGEARVELLPDLVTPAHLAAAVERAGYRLSERWP
jgi:P-type Cu+ transporter